MIKFADHFSKFLSVNKEIMKVKPMNMSSFDDESFINDKHSKLE